MNRLCRVHSPKNLRLRLEERLLGVEPRNSHVLTGPLRGVRLELSRAHQTRQWIGRYEREVMAALLAAPRTGGIAWDVGAYIGYLTMLLARNYPHVVAIEPEPRNVAALRANLARNGIQNTEVIETAVGTSNGVADLVIGESTSQNALSSVSGESVLRRGSIAQQVRVLTLDHLLEQHGRPDVVKIDIEGAEGAALTAAPRLISARPSFVVEIHGEANERTVRQLLADYAIRRAGNSLVATPSER